MEDLCWSSSYLLKLYLPPPKQKLFQILTTQWRFSLLILYSFFSLVIGVWYIYPSIQPFNLVYYEFFSYNTCSNLKISITPTSSTLNNKLRNLKKQLVNQHGYLGKTLNSFDILLDMNKMFTLISKSIKSSYSSLVFGGPITVIVSAPHLKYLNCT